jgi:hypothetical protein
MKIYFDDPEYDGQFLRSVDYTPVGAQIGEAWAIAAQIEVGGHDELVQRVVVLCRPIVRARRQDARHRASGQRAQCIFARIELLSRGLYFHVRASR